MKTSKMIISIGAMALALSINAFAADSTPSPERVALAESRLATLMAEGIRADFVRYAEVDALLHKCIEINQHTLDIPAEARAEIDLQLHNALRVLETDRAALKARVAK